MHTLILFVLPFAFYVICLCVCARVCVSQCLFPHLRLCLQLPLLILPFICVHFCLSSVSIRLSVCHCWGQQQTTEINKSKTCTNTHTHTHIHDGIRNSSQVLRQMFKFPSQLQARTEAELSLAQPQIGTSEQFPQLHTTFNIPHSSRRLLTQISINFKTFKQRQKLLQFPKALDTWHEKRTT